MDKEPEWCFGMPDERNTRCQDCEYNMECLACCEELEYNQQAERVESGIIGMR
jgi:hypothetical protein